MSTAKMVFGGLKSLLPRQRSYSMASQGTDVPYGYSVWLRHRTLLARHGLPGPYETVVELGPGNSVTTGVAAILSGAKRYVGLDVIRHLSPEPTEIVLEQLLALFRDRAPIPNDATHKEIRPIVESYDFPASAFGESDLLGVDDPSRLSGLRHDLKDIAGGGQGGNVVRYIVPWDRSSIPANSVNLIFSQAVLQEIPHGARRSALLDLFRTTAAWLAPGGVAAHQIDLGMYGLQPWNVHWTWSSLMWKLVRGRRENFVNREPLSTYLSLVQEAGLVVVACEVEEVEGAPYSALSRPFKRLATADRVARSAFLIVRKP